MTFKELLEKKITHVEVIIRQPEKKRIEFQISPDSITASGWRGGLGDESIYWYFKYTGSTLTLVLNDLSNSVIDEVYLYNGARLKGSIDDVKAVVLEWMNRPLYPETTTTNKEMWERSHGTFNIDAIVK